MVLLVSTKDPVPPEERAAVVTIEIVVMEVMETSTYSESRGTNGSQYNVLYHRQ